MKLNGAHSWDAGPEPDPEQPVIPKNPMIMKATIIQNDLRNAWRPGGIKRFRAKREFAIAEGHSLLEKNKPVI
jgi:hypothetical protein